jgi:hypothetical protein
VVEEARALAKVASLAFAAEVLMTQKATRYRSDEGLVDVGRANCTWAAYFLLVTVESYEYVFPWILDPHIHFVACFDKQSKHPPVTHFWAGSFRRRLQKGRIHFTRTPGSRHVCRARKSVCEVR